METGKDGLAGFQKVKPEKELRMDPLSEKETFLRFVARFWELEESNICEDGHWSYYDKGTKMLVSVKPVEPETFDHEYRVQIIDQMND